MRRAWVFVMLSPLATGCAGVAAENVEGRSPLERRAPPLLSDRLAPAEASAKLAERYPHASVADMRGTCGLDPACDVRARERVWLESHNRNIVRIEEERRQEDDASRRHQRTVVFGEWVLGFVLVSGAIASVALGASVR